jgi:hypothetical protein
MHQRELPEAGRFGELGQAMDHIPPRARYERRGLGSSVMREYVQEGTIRNANAAARLELKKCSPETFPNFQGLSGGELSCSKFGHY